MAPSDRAAFDLGLGLEDTHVLVTGGCGLIGKVVVQAFLSAGCFVSIIDLAESSPHDEADEKVLYMKADITDAQQIDHAFTMAENKFERPVECCVALASLDLSVLPQSESLADMDPKTWQRVFDVNVNGTFMTCQRWLRSIRKAVQSGRAEALRNTSLVIVGSESGRFGVRTMAAYAAGKSAVQYGLLHSLAQDAPRLFHKARVNAVAPGAVDTERFQEEARQYGEDWLWKECEATYVEVADLYSVG